MRKLFFSLLLLTLVSFGSAQEITIAMIPKLVGIDYFNATEQGAMEAAAELGNVRLIYRGPTEGRADRQIELIENFITAGVDVISVAANDPDALAPALQRAMDAGITVVTWDADASARDVFINQATFQGIGEALINSMVDQIGADGKAVIITSDLTAPNQNSWIAAMRAKMASDYPDFEILDTRAPGEDQQRAFQATQDALNAYPEVQGFFALSSVAFPGAADAVEQAGRSGEVAVVGLSTPKQMKPFVDDGTVRDVVLWNPIDLGYLSVYAAVAAVNGELEAGATIEAGRLGSYTVEEDDISLQILLGPPFIFDAANIADFDF
jgi:ABC-type sugar transport system substrate-binding protein